MSTKYKMLRVSKETHELLATQGNLSDSFDSVINKLIKKNQQGLETQKIKE